MTNFQSNDPKFFVCKECGNQIEIIDASGVIPVCCGKPMSLLVPNSSDGRLEFHEPHATIKHDKVYVEVGDLSHPMDDNHHIKWIALLTSEGLYRKEVSLQSKPTAVFRLLKYEQPKAVYAYCNVHGLYIETLVL